MKAYSHEKGGEIFIEKTTKGDIPHFTVFINKKDAQNQMLVFNKRYEGCRVIQIDIKCCSRSAKTKGRKQ